LQWEAGNWKLLLEQGALFAEGAAPFSVLFSEVTKIKIVLPMSFDVHWLQNKIFFSLPDKTDLTLHKVQMFSGLYVQYIR
jgi:hypothetical protein